ncbi:hypothetical protein AB4Z18_14510 [Leifsonia sp. 2TAF2]|uniref:hypothetical protein n=1 Tax=Leifsonia sp. 2TAF2 TaxID=3233009 RepID=UPI003F9E291D
MPDFGSNEANLAYLIQQFGSGLHDLADGVHDGIAALIHHEAVGMLNSVLPPLVHAKNTLVRTGGWVPVEAHTIEIGGRLAGVTVSNAILSGLVQKKVEEGVGTITANLDYTHGVNTIT